MKARLKTSAPLLIIIFFSFIYINCSKNLQGDLIIKNVNIVDVKTGNINPAMDVVIKGDSISIIVESAASNNYKVEKVIDGTDKYLIPLPGGVTTISFLC